MCLDAFFVVSQFSKTISFGARRLYSRTTMVGLTDCMSGRAANGVEGQKWAVPIHRITVIFPTWKYTNGTQLSRRGTYTLHTLITYKAISSILFAIPHIRHCAVACLLKLSRIRIALTLKIQWIIVQKEKEKEQANKNDITTKSSMHKQMQHCGHGAKETITSIMYYAIN